MEEKKAVAEAALFLSEEPLSTGDLAEVMNLGSKGFVQDVVDEMKEELEDDSRGLKMVESEEGYEIVVKSDLLDDVEHLAPHRDLNEAELRTLALVAYNAPVKQSEIVEVRGNRAYSHVKELERRGFVSSEEEGRTKVLEVTDHFLDYFDLDSARDFAEGAEVVQEGVDEPEEAEHEMEEEDTDAAGAEEQAEDPVEEEEAEEEEQNGIREPLERAEAGGETEDQDL